MFFLKRCLCVWHASWFKTVVYELLFLFFFDLDFLMLHSTVSLPGANERGSGDGIPGLVRLLLLWICLCPISA